MLFFCLTIRIRELNTNNSRRIRKLRAYHNTLHTKNNNKKKKLFFFF